MESASTLDADLMILPEHLHEWGRNLEAEANLFQRKADEHAHMFALKFEAQSVLGDQADE